MQIKAQIAAIILAAAVVWGGYLFVTGQELTWKMIAPFGVTVSVVTVVSALFVKYLWKWRIFRHWLVERPDIAGTWKCQLKSSFTEEGKTVDKTVYVVIRQTLTSVSFRLYTDKAKSVSIADKLSKDEPDLFKLAIAYQNIPNVQFRDCDSQIHYGAALFTDFDYDAHRVEGHYWTDRNTHGALILLEKKERFVSSFEDAKALFN